MIMNVVSSTPPDTAEGEFRVIVPDQAKSAATLIALGAKGIVMSNTSELGPIDPQVPRADSDGRLVWHSVFDYISAYEQAEKIYREDPDDPASKAIFNRFDPVLLQCYRQMVAYAQTCAENLMKPYGGNWTLAPSVLLDTTRFHDHGQFIDWETARHDIGLNVEFMDPRDSLWISYWKLYCHLRRAITDDQKIFESLHVSLVA